jgi:hypothetical protein
MPVVYYLAPDHATPSWGTALLYHHVRLLGRNGVAAAILHHRTPFRLDWLDVPVPVRYLDEPGFVPAPEDILVVPEVLARAALHLPFRCRRLVFVQGPFLMLSPFPEAVDYAALGYEGGLVVMPGDQRVLERHFGLRPAVVPPFVAPYFFAAPGELEGHGRRRRILLVPKSGYSEAGIPDYEIVRKLVARRCRRVDAGAWSVPDSHAGEWDFLEINGLSHREVAAAMRTAAFLVSVNSHEGFNATVPEAMASGCVAVCCEASGGRDYLVDRENAFVFPNQAVYDLADTLFEQLDRFDDSRLELNRIRANAHATALRYQEDGTESALLDLFRPLLV